MTEPGPVIGVDHWHIAMSVYVCERFVEALYTEGPAAQLDVSANADGIVHVHPRSPRAARLRPSVGMLAGATGMQLGDSSVIVRSESERSDGEPCATGPGRWTVAKWDRADQASPTMTDHDLASVEVNDRSSVALAFVPAGTSVPRPPSNSLVGDLANTKNQTVDEILQAVTVQQSGPTYLLGDSWVTQRTGVEPRQDDPDAYVAGYIADFQPKTAGRILATVVAFSSADAAARYATRLTQSTSGESEHLGSVNLDARVRVKDGWAERMVVGQRGRYAFLVVEAARTNAATAPPASEDLLTVLGALTRELAA